ncbi:MAG: TerB family tellurite resistance protein [Planctomycetota bacterium]
MASYCSKLTGKTRREEKHLTGQPESPASFRGIDDRSSRALAQEITVPTDMTILNCRVKLTTVTENNFRLDAFGVEICGTIHAPDDTSKTILRVSILDITDGPSEPKPVHAGYKNGVPPTGSEVSEFSHEADLGKLPQKVTTLTDWTSVAQLPVDRQVYPRRGERNVQFNISILSANGDEALAYSKCTFAFENRANGYLDLQDNAERTNVLTVALAFTVSAANDKLYECEIEMIKNWARENILDDSGPDPDQAQQELDEAMNSTVEFFKKGNKIDMYGLCEEIVEIAPLANRLDILDLCLRVAQASGTVSVEEISILKGMSSWLEIDSGRFRTMMEKALPVDMHEVLDLEEVLGITEDMSKEKTRRHLNKEYSKWNYRVTNADPNIQNQADEMLKLIAGARGQYVTEDTDQQEPAKAK